MNYNDSRFVLGLSLMLFSSCFFVGMSEPEEQESGWSHAFGGFLQGVKDGHDAATAHVANTQDSASCMKSLLPCQPFLHSPSPPLVCCVPLQGIVENDSQCLCTIFKNNELLKTFNLTQEDALALPKACGIAANATDCDHEPDSPDNSTTPSTPSTPATPSTTPASGTSSPATPTEKPAADNAAPVITNVKVHFIASLVALIISAAA